MPLTPEHSSSQHDYVDLNSENRPARVQGSEGLLLKGFAEERKKKSSQVGNFEVRIEDLPIANLWNLSQALLRDGLVLLQASNCE